MSSYRRSFSFCLLLSFILFITSCSKPQALLHPDDLEIKVDAYRFVNVIRYRAEVGALNESISNKDYEEPMKRTVQIVAKWGLEAEKDVEYESRLFYEPYIIIRPLDRYHWSEINRNYDLCFLDTCISTEVHNVIMKAMEKSSHQLDWYNQPDPFLWVLHAKSFGQGMVTLNLTSDDDYFYPESPFKAYFVYYDPVLDDGWIKEIPVAAHI